MIKRYTLQEINKYARDLSGLRFVLESEHDDSMAAVQSDKEKLADLMISAGFELVMLQRRHEKMIASVSALIENPFDSLYKASVKIILDEDEKLKGRNDSVGPNEEDARGESVVPEVRPVLSSDGA